MAKPGFSEFCTPEEATAPNPKLREATGSIWPHIALLLVQIVAYNVPNFPKRRLVFGAGIVVLAIAAQLNLFTQDIATANMFALAWPHYLSTLEKIVFAGDKGPEADLWRLDKPEQEALSFPPFSYQKLKWSLMLLLNLRGVDWSFQIPKIPKKGSRYSSRARFLIAQSAELFGVLFMADLVSHAMIRLNFSRPGYPAGTLNSKCLTLRDPDPFWSFLRTLAYGAGPYYFINMQYITCSIVAVALGLSQPKDWPPLFGKLAEVTTVRKFWGEFWQQMMRRFFTTYSRQFTRFLGIKRGTNLSSYTQLWMTFTVSGFFHAASILLMPSPENITFYERTAGIMYYFLWQAAVITLEDFLQWLWKRLFGEPRGPTHLIGYFWVICSFWISLPWAGDVMLRVKMGETSPLPTTWTARLVEHLPLR